MSVWKNIHLPAKFQCVPDARVWPIATSATICTWLYTFIHTLCIYCRHNWVNNTYYTAHYAMKNRWMLLLGINWEMQPHTLPGADEFWAPVALAVVAAAFVGANRRGYEKRMATIWSNNNGIKKYKEHIYIYICINIYIYIHFTYSHCITTTNRILQWKYTGKYWKYQL